MSMAVFSVAACLALAGFGWGNARADPLNLAVDRAVVMDFDSGLVVYAKKADEPMPPSSMSKLMTMLMVFEALERGELQLDQLLKVSDNAWRVGGAATGGSTMFLRPGQEVAVADLMRGVIIVSGNDACVVLAEALAGSEAAFADKMTARAQELGLATARFRNSTGLTAEGHEISPRDLAKLAQIILQRFPDHAALYAERSFRFNNVTQQNRNPLLGAYRGADGLKTGYTAAAGYGLVATAIANGQRMITVFNGAESQAKRAEIAKQLMDAALTQARAIRIAEPGAKLASAPVLMGRKIEVALTVEAPIVLGLMQPARDSLRVQARLVGPIKAPIVKGQKLGVLRVSADGADPIDAPLLAAEDVARAPWYARALALLSVWTKGEGGVQQAQEAGA